MPILFAMISRIRTIWTRRRCPRSTAIMFISMVILFPQSVRSCSFDCRTKFNRCQLGPSRWYKRAMITAMLITIGSDVSSRTQHEEYEKIYTLCIMIMQRQCLNQVMIILFIIAIIISVILILLMMTRLRCIRSTAMILVLLRQR